MIFVSTPRRGTTRGAAVAFDAPMIESGAAHRGIYLCNPLNEDPLSSVKEKT
jgi:hypothetical protein